ncbi:penicillin-binding protein 1A [Varunaivibrio sulfuroxidans]|uniref:Penicillin-binding protein 1A n=1 Tax=Varunaivibrio sulfuroxidans TaxID=1773489 RepID=A0A4R3JAU9_9PROT|nr:penicillin-binding protein 1A [Varunaivibrio sulfuroxidans]TCS62153.1 penicillin-binding protein 1A [Varunaivibrio sulfuroxidans]WES30582.1 penicillin-binding protein 1A [Varunaivibrio sulfuroxidans]
MWRVLATFLGGLVILAFIGAGAVGFIFVHYGRDLPDYKQLANYDPPVMTRVHAGDGRLLAEYANEKRIFVPIRSIPRLLIHAVLSAEDKNFYEHFGVDPLSLLRAVITNIKNYGSGKRPIGASTITQQVAKNFLLTNEVSITRKIKEAILALRIERAFSKDRILELYLNEVYLGRRSYGVAAAALNYFNKPMDKLTIAESAYLAALLKAPGNYSIARHPKAAKERRDWVISRLRINGYITADQAARATAEPLRLRRRDDTEYVTAPYYAEEVRRELVARFGEKKLYDGGLSVRTSLNPAMQDMAVKSLEDGLQSYDRRHGWRGPLAHFSGPDTALKLAHFTRPAGLKDWRVALVAAVRADEAGLRFKDGTKGVLPLARMTWARAWEKGERVGPRVRKVSDVLKVGDVIAVEAVRADEASKATAVSASTPVVSPTGVYALRQIPAIQGAIVAMDPHTGRVLAMVGGWDYDMNQFNRAVQAYRQPGSAFKPFVYLAALDSGFTPSTLILDAPFVIDQGPGLPKWRPANYTQKFYGPSTMRLGLEKSRNLMTVRLAQTVGMDKIAAYAKRFGVTDNLPHQLSMALGAGETTLLKLTSAYSMLVNGGKYITPAFIDRIQDRNGVTIFKNDKRVCTGCRADVWMGQSVPQIPDVRKQVTDPASAYQMVSMLEGVVQRGTGRRIRSLKWPLAGKTGTTNKAMDAWFVGFSPDLAVGVYTGFDDPHSLGPHEQGASVAVPIFREFMAKALTGKPPTPFRIPPGIRLVRVDATTGRPALPGDRNVILEAFKPGTIPMGKTAVLDGVETVSGEAPTPAVGSGSGGLY